MTTEFKFPDLGEGITEGEVKKWLVKEGDRVEADQSLAEVETDKAVVEIPSPTAGKVLGLRFDEGDIVKVGQVLAVIGDEGETVEEAAVEKKEKAVKERESVSVVGELPEEEGELVEVLALPKVRKLAKELGVELTTIKGSGKEGRILEKDVRAAAERIEPEKETVEKKPEAKRPRKVPKFDIYGWIERVPLRGIRRTTARRMIESQQTAAAVTSMDYADLTELVALREKEKKAAMESRGIKLTYMPFIIRAVVEALKMHPYLNSTLDEDKEEIILKKYYNIGIAVATEEGLIVPVIKGADQKSILELAEEIAGMVEQASSRKIDLADLKGGTFTITNYGVFGGTYGTPIINYPEVAILGTGAIRDQPLVVGGELRVRKVLHLSLTFDHRVLDGAEAQRFLNSVIDYLENPALILMST